MIEGGGNDEMHQLEKIEEIENLEAKLFQEIEASNKKSTGTSNTTNSNIKQVSSVKRDSQTKKVIGAAGPRRSAASIKTQPTRSSPSSGGSGSSPNVKSSATLQRRSVTSETGSKTPPGITTKNKVSSVNTRLPKTSPASPVTPGSSGSSSSSTSTFSVNQRSKSASSVPRRSTVSNEKPSTNKGRSNDARKTDKPLGGLMPKTISSISLKNKPPPLNSHPLSPLGLSNSSPDKIGKQPAALRSQTGSVSRPSSAQPMGCGMPSHQHSKPGSPNDGKARKLQPPKTVAVNGGLKPNSQKTTTPKPSKKQSSVKEKRSSSASRDAKNIFVMSPEILDIKGKINALKIEISMQKKDRCIKAPAESVKRGIEF